MRGAQDIVFGVAGQKLIWDAPEGRPSSVASVQVFRLDAGDESTAELAVAGSPAIDAMNTTVDQASGGTHTNPRRLYVADTTKAVCGRSYLVVGAGGARERVDILDIAAGDYLTTRYPMANSFAPGALVVGTRITAELDLSWISDRTKLTGGRDANPGYRVRWVYTVAGAQYVHDSYFDLARFGGGHSLTAADVDREYPGVKAMAGVGHRADDLRGLLDQAYERFRWDLTDIGLDDNAVMDQDAVNRAVLLAFGVLVAKSRTLQSGGGMDILDMAERDYQAFVNKVFRVGQKVAIAVDAGGGAAPSSSLPILVR